MDDEGFDHTVLCKFRGMLVENDQTKLCFEIFRNALIEAGLIKSGEAAVIDTTHGIAYIAIPNTIGLVETGIKEVLQAGAKHHVGIGNQLAKGLELGFVYEKSSLTEQQDRLVALLMGARRLLSYLEKSGDDRHSAMVDAVSQLRRILHENTDSGPGGEIRKNIHRA